MSPVLARCSIEVILPCDGLFTSITTTEEVRDSRRNQPDRFLTHDFDTVVVTPNFEWRNSNMGSSETSNS